LSCTNPCDMCKNEPADELDALEAYWKKFQTDQLAWHADHLAGTNHDMWTGCRVVVATGTLGTRLGSD